MVGIMSDQSMQILPVLSDFEIAPIEIAPNTPSDNKFMLTTTNGEMNNQTSTLTDGNTNGDTEISICVVCDKRFKSKPCLNKHMRSVHTVKILTTAKRTSSISTSNPKAAISKRSQSNDSQSSITHIGLPVNPITAKALASKLNERNNILNGQATKMNGNGIKTILSTATKPNDIPVPPLVSIQTPSSQKETKPSETDNKNGVNEAKANAVNPRKRPSNTEIDAETSDDDEQQHMVSNRKPFPAVSLSPLIDQISFIV